MKRFFLYLGGLVLALGVPMVQTPAQAQITGTGWVADFYANTTMTGSPTANGVSYPNGLYFNWGQNPPTNSAGTPIAGMPADNFSAVFTSTQQFNSVGVYNFTIFNNDGIRVYVNNVLYVDQLNVFNNPNPNTYQTYTFDYENLSAGPVDMRVEYVEYQHDANLVLQWAEPQPNIGQNLLLNSGFEVMGESVSVAKDWLEAGMKNDKRICNSPGKPAVTAYGTCAYQFNAAPSLSYGIKRTLKQRIAPEVLADISIGDGLVFGGITWSKNLYGVKRNIYAILVYDDGPLAGTRRKVSVGLPSGSYYHLPFNKVLVYSTVGSLRSLEFGVNLNSVSGNLRMDQLRLGWVIGGVNLNTPIADAPLLALPLAFPIAR